MTGIDKRVVSKYEKDQTVPSVKMANSIAKALDVSLDYLVNGSMDEKAKSTLHSTELLGKFKELESLPKSEQEALEKVIEAYLRDSKSK